MVSRTLPVEGAILSLADVCTLHQLEAVADATSMIEVQPELACELRMAEAEPRNPAAAIICTRVPDGRVAPSTAWKYWGW
jgi:hypothetical protein